jgi:hypothetical protein
MIQLKMSKESEYTFQRNDIKVKKFTRQNAHYHQSAGKCNSPQRDTSSHPLNLLKSKIQGTRVTEGVEKQKVSRSTGRNMNGGVILKNGLIIPQIVKHRVTFCPVFTLSVYQGEMKMYAYRKNCSQMLISLFLSQR